MTPMNDQDQLVRLASDAPAVYQDAMNGFLGRGAAAASVLVQGLANPRLGPTAHWRILLVLRELRVPSTLPAILDAFNTALRARDPVVLPGAMEALAVFDSPEAVSALASVLGSGNPDFARHAAALLGDKARQAGAAGAASQAALASLLADPDPQARENALRGLARTATPSARELLRRHRAVETDARVIDVLKGLP